ncbi:hypothetical protein ABPG72_018404 [Tetrahymena utriculariae]
MTDHFNWPALNRKDLMSLSKIEFDENVGKKRLQIQRDSSSLRNEDIDGAKTFYRHTKYMNKESFLNRCDDINEKERSSSPKYTNLYFMRIDDIEGAQAKKKFVTSRNTNPLSPVYVLPTSAYIAPLENKFIRDTLYVKDIEGATAKPDTRYFKERNVNPYTEVEGSRPRQRFIPKDKVNSLEVKDINNDGIFKTTRTTNPLDPKYNLSTLLKSDMNLQQEIQDYGFIDGSKSRIRHPSLNKEKSFSLNTKDILGAHANAIPEKFVNLNNTRKDFISTNKIDDIPGAQKSTLIKGMITKRCVDPNVPQYSFPGHTEAYSKPIIKRNRVYSQMSQNSQENDQQRNLSVSKRVQLEPLSNQSRTVANQRSLRSQSVYSQNRQNENLNKTNYSTFQDQAPARKQLENGGNKNSKVEQTANERENINLKNILNANSNNLLLNLETNDISISQSFNKNGNGEGYKTNAQKLDSFINKQVE